MSWATTFGTLGPGTLDAFGTDCLLRGLQWYDVHLGEASETDVRLWQLKGRWHDGANHWMSLFMVDGYLVACVGLTPNEEHSAIIPPGLGGDFLSYMSQKFPLEGEGWPAFEGRMRDQQLKLELRAGGGHATP